jgi:hypothetical protein
LTCYEKNSYGSNVLSFKGASAMKLLQSLKFIYQLFLLIFWNLGVNILFMQVCTMNLVQYLEKRSSCHSL